MSPRNGTLVTSVLSTCSKMPPMTTVPPFSTSSSVCTCLVLIAGPAGVAYNHPIYIDGYRHRGRPLGHWADGDSNLWTVGGLARELFGGQGLAVLRYGTLNESGASTTWPDSRLSSLSVQWRKLFDRVFALTLALDHVSQSWARPGGGDEHWRDTQLRVQFDAWLY